MRCYVFIQTTKLHIFSIYGNFLLFIFYFLKDMRTEEQVFFERHKNRRTCFFERHENRRTSFFERHKNRRTSFFERHENRRTSFIPQPKNMFFCSSVLSPQAIPMFFCLITMHIFLIPIKILNCFSLPFQISFILLYINILSLRKIENSIYTFYRNGTSTL